MLSERECMKVFDNVYDKLDRVYHIDKEVYYPAVLFIDRESLDFMTDYTFYGAVGLFDSQSNTIWILDNQSDVISTIKHEMVHSLLYQLNRPWKDSDSEFRLCCMMINAPINRKEG